MAFFAFVRSRAWLLLALCLCGCAGPGRVGYDAGRCLTDGRPMTSDEVETEQAVVAQRIASRQPWFAVITIGVVLLAAASNAERVVLLVRSRHHEGHRPFAERLRELLARQRDNPVLFATLVGASLLLVATGGIFYIYLDVDKRASERALGMLQFCHMALRAETEQTALDEERKNLQAIQSTAGDIRTLVGKLPPDEQRKAQLIVSQMNDALTRQGRIVGEYASRTDEAQKDLSTHAMAMEKGLASLQGDVAELRSLPTNVRDIAAATRRIDEATLSLDGRFDDLRERLGVVETKVDALLARPAVSQPALVAPTKVATPATPDAGVHQNPPPARDGGVATTHT